VPQVEKRLILVRKAIIIRGVNSRERISMTRADRGVRQIDACARHALSKYASVGMSRRLTKTVTASCNLALRESGETMPGLRWSAFIYGHLFELDHYNVG